MSTIKRTTTNYDLRIPIFDAPGWGREFERNMDILDAALFLVSGFGNVKGVWTNDTPYNVGERVVDQDTGQLFQNTLQHTSPATGTFAAYRQANPQTWTPLTNSAQFRGAWTTGTAYNVNDFLYDDHRYGVVTTGFVSSASYDQDVLDGNIISLIDIRSDYTDVTNSANLVAGLSTEIEGVYAISAELIGVYAISADVVTVSTNSAAISALALLDTEISALYAIRTSISALDAISADVTSVAAISSDVTTVASIKEDIETVASNSANVTITASISGEIVTVSGIAADVTTVADKAADVSSVAGNMGAILAAEGYAAAAEEAAEAAEEAENRIALAAVPIGAVFFDPLGVGWPGFLELNGSSFDTDVYPDLALLYPSGVLPDFTDRVPRGAGPLAGAAGTTQEDAMQRITGETTPYLASAQPSAGTGALDVDINTGQTRGLNTGSGVYPASILVFDSGNSPGARVSDDETRVKAVIGKWYIKAYGAFVNPGDVDLVAIEQAQQQMVRKDAQTLSSGEKAQVALNLGLPISRMWESAEQPITNGGGLTLAHGLGVEPVMVQALLVCQTAEAGYSVGDVLVVPAYRDGANTSANVRGLACVLDDTNVFIRFVGNTVVFNGIAKDTGEDYQFTNANWRLIVRAFA